MPFPWIVPTSLCLGPCVQGMRQYPSYGDCAPQLIVAVPRACQGARSIPDWVPWLLSSSSSVHRLQAKRTAAAVPTWLGLVP